MKQELQPSKTGVPEFEQVLSGVKICNTSTASLQAVLRRVMLLVGIRANNLPSPEETQILTAFIYKKYSGLTLNEIQLAFEKAVAGELECEANCYENFSCSYFGQIMSAYKKWASQKFNENQMYVVKPQTENLLTMPADWKELCEMNYQQYLTGKYNVELWPWEIYDECVKANYISENAYEDYLIAGYKILLSKDAETNAQREKMFEIKKQFLKHPQVIDMAKRLAVEVLYKTAQKVNYTHLFIKE